MIVLQFLFDSEGVVLYRATTWHLFESDSRGPGIYKLQDFV